jgi:ribosomal-protein-alanine N-acetyltransferase
MTSRLATQRLDLIALDLYQLQSLLLNVAALEKTLGLPIRRTFIDSNVRRALRRKVEKMGKAPLAAHDWFTYWLIVIREEQAGVGLIGFKGAPDGSGSTEIGYGIDPGSQNKGYMTEAVRALVDWAFSHRDCRLVTATAVSNPASNRVLEKLGAQLVEATPERHSWKIVRPSSKD